VSLLVLETRVLPLDVEPLLDVVPLLEVVAAPLEVVVLAVAVECSYARTPNPTAATALATTRLVVTFPARRIPLSRESP
jgi:hypothetical protein